MTITDDNGGKAGIWQSGFGLPTDGNRIFVTTGNGQGEQNVDAPASGRLPLSTKNNAVVNFFVGSDGILSSTDYFQPYDYIGMDQGDRDLGSSGTCLLDGSVFNGAGVSRIGVSVGKPGKMYILNADNLGGYRQGPSNTDLVVQTILLPKAVYGGVGSYPLDGGYIYVTPVGSNTLAYKLGHDSTGAPVFSLAGTSAAIAAGRSGVGQMTVTSYKGQAGSGIVCLTT